MPERLEGQWIVRNDARIALVVSRFNSFLTEHLLAGATDAYQRMGGDPESLTILHVPGSFELPVTALKLAESGRYAAIICLGVVIRGETAHYDHVCEQTARGIREVGTNTGVPCIFGVVTTDTVEQALNRCGVKLGNQGEKSMLAAVEMADLLRKINDNR